MLPSLGVNNGTKQDIIHPGFEGASRVTGVVGYGCTREGTGERRSFTELLCSAFRQGGRRGRQWNEFLLPCPHYFIEQYSSARRGGGIILHSHEPKPHESFPDLHLGQHSFRLLWATESKSFRLPLMFHVNAPEISFCLVLTFTTSSRHSPHFQSEF